MSAISSGLGDGGIAPRRPPDLVRLVRPEQPFSGFSSPAVREKLTLLSDTGRFAEMTVVIDPAATLFPYDIGTTVSFALHHQGVVRARLKRGDLSPPDPSWRIPLGADSLGDFPSAMQRAAIHDARVLDWQKALIGGLSLGQVMGAVERALPDLSQGRFDYFVHPGIVELLERVHQARGQVVFIAAANSIITRALLARMVEPLIPGLVGKADVIGTPVELLGADGAAFNSTELSASTLSLILGNASSSNSIRFSGNGTVPPMIGATRADVLAASGIEPSLLVTGCFRDLTGIAPQAASRIFFFEESMLADTRIHRNWQPHLLARMREHNWIKDDTLAAREQAEALTRLTRPSFTALEVFPRARWNGLTQSKVTPAGAPNSAA